MSGCVLAGGLQVGSGLDQSEPYRICTHVVMNPPFGQVQAPSQLPWASGLVNRAAIFIWTAITRMQPSARLVAVVPDVLRSGTRYQRFRSAISAYGEVSFPIIHERFDQSTDVHTAILDFVRRPQSAAATLARSASKHPTVGDLFTIKVGPLVPFRHRDGETPRLPYLHPGNCPRWGALEMFNRDASIFRYNISAPFVVIRRTSRPEDQYRAVPTLITVGPQEFAIENHLLVATQETRPFPAASSSSPSFVVRPPVYGSTRPSGADI
jgi:hypothetical protein